MLNSIKKYSKTFFFKVLVGIIILPFLFWGMGDVFSGGSQNVVAKIDSEKVTEFHEYFLEEVKKIDEIYINGDIKKRLPANINLSIPNVNATKNLDLGKKN